MCLFSTLAQMLQKRPNKHHKPKHQKDASGSITQAKVDQRFVLERNIISLLLLYGNEEVSFEDVVLQSDDEGKIELTPTEISAEGV
ncbi:MAG: hypothetical protein CM15mP59_1880 [Flavobacteriaceae bacterium]|nr:MAG: hypothetical protein CM15mP59_1880 [Flavobacteriaceae bacterium]